MNKRFNLIILFSLFFLIIGCSNVGVSPGIGIGWGSGGHFGAGISLNTWTTSDSLGKDEVYKNFYIKNFNYLVKKYDNLIKNKDTNLEEIKELKVKMLALRHQVNTDWNEIEKRKKFIEDFNKKIDFYINSLNNLEK
ncbi:hypothetical protein [uncultured Fusobacterium sp.]|jgi:peptidoglycan hydrolase CwlO-like protein|uniref:hypothetical protein n=1 Tax=uncultured Fusobacterium sp. TaxID=159267 RepID=UPI0025E7C06E|nr:hypothetical protein [uncultured Fusobacterium sp.]